MGFLPQRCAMAERTAPRTDSAKASGSLRRARGRDSNVLMTASNAMSASGSPSAVLFGMPVSSTSGSVASSPLRLTASATDTKPAKLSRRRLVDDCRGLGCQPDHVAVFAHHDLLDPEPACECGVLGEMQRFAMHRNDGLRPDPAVHLLHLGAP